MYKIAYLLTILLFPFFSVISVSPVQYPDRRWPVSDTASLSNTHDFLLFHSTFFREIMEKAKTGQTISIPDFDAPSTVPCVGPSCLYGRGTISEWWQVKTRSIATKHSIHWSTCMTLCSRTTMCQWTMMTSTSPIVDKRVATYSAASTYRRLIYFYEY